MAKLRLLLKHLIVGREFESNFGSKCDGRQMNVCVCAHTFVRFNSILPWRPHHKCVYFPFSVKPPAVLARGAWVFYDILVPLPFGFLTPSLMLPYPPTTTIPLSHPDVISNDCKLFIQIHQSSAITPSSALATTQALSGLQPFHQRCLFNFKNIPVPVSGDLWLQMDCQYQVMPA